MDAADVRSTNLAVVLRCVRDLAPCSRADIAAATGLNKTTVSSLVSELLKRRLLREVGTTGNRVGRPAVLLTLDGASYAAIGIEVSTDYLSAVAVDIAGRTVLSWRRALPGATGSPARALTAVASLTRRVIARAERDGRKVLGLAVALPGTLGPDPSGSAGLPGSFPAPADSPGAPGAPGSRGPREHAGDPALASAAARDWRDADFAADLAAALRLPGLHVETGNDADFGVLAEHRYGPHAGTADLVYLAGGGALGAGLVIDGALRAGSAGYSGEIGHIPVVPGGPACHCGRRGCMEAVAGIAAVIRRAAADPQTPDIGGRPPIAEMEPLIDEITARARAGDAATLDALTGAGRDLGAGIAILANVLDPRVVVLGGHYAELAPWLLPAAGAELRDRAIAAEHGGCRVVASTLGLDAPALGATARILDAVETGRLPGDPHTPARVRGGRAPLDPSRAARAAERPALPAPVPTATDGTPT
ncbi:ROK family protein [Nocardiopsis mangrovi]|uniref:ROK family protein n=1 Tax=Nocardiopsis mangrovi TaxID=1179818 RepID=A0ABV9DW97_9ACTN